MESNAVSGAPAVQSPNHKAPVDPAASSVTLPGYVQSVTPPNPSNAESPHNGQALAPAPSHTTFEGQAIQSPSSPGAVIVDGHSVDPGQDSTLNSGATVALHSNGHLVPDTSTLAAFPPSPPPTQATFFTFGRHTLSISSNNVLEAGSTIKPNDPGVTLDGIEISLGASESKIGTSTIVLETPPSSATSPVIIAGGQQLTVVSNGVAFSGTTLSSAQAITVDGTPISHGGDSLVVGTSTLPLPGPTAAPASAPMITAAGQPISVAPNGALSIAGTILIPNAPAVTISGTPMALRASELVVGSSTVPIPIPASLPQVTAAGQQVNIAPDGDVSIAGTILNSDTPAITVSSTLVSVEGSALVVGSSTISIQSIESAVTQGIGGLILSGLNGGPAAPSVTGSPSSTKTPDNTTAGTGGPQTFLGSGHRVFVDYGALAASLLAVVLTT